MELGKLTITVSETRNGNGVYVQIASPAAVPVNIVLIADEVESQDARKPQFRTARALDSARHNSRSRKARR